MADDRGQKENTPLTPDEVSQHEFATTFRGYDPGEVRSFLDRVSGRLRALEELSRGLRGRLAQMQADARAGRVPEESGEGAGAAAVEPAPVDETLLLDALGEQAAHILRSAHEAADAVARRAEESARRRGEDAEAEANRIRLQAEATGAARIREADAEAAVVVAQAHDDGERIRATAKAEADRIVEDGRHRGREIVEEAQAVRERVLGDLMKRRRIAQVQIEQLRAGRERLLEAYRVVRRTLDDVTDELQRADAEARAAADAVGRRLAGEPGRSLPTVPTGPKPAEGRSADAPQKRTFVPRPEPPASPLPGRDRSVGAEPARSSRPARGDARPRSEASRAPDAGALAENVRIIGRGAPGPAAASAAAREPETEPEPAPQAEPEAVAEEPFPAFPGTVDDDAAIAGLAETLDAERAMTAWTESERVVTPPVTEREPAAEAGASTAPAPVAEVAPPPATEQAAPAEAPLWPQGRDAAAPPPPPPTAGGAAAGEPLAVSPSGAEAEPEPGADAPERQVVVAEARREVDERVTGASPVVAPAAAVLAAPEAPLTPAPEEAHGAGRAEAPAEARGAGRAEAPARHARPELDQLFARIRSERAEAVARAHEVLGSAAEPGAGATGPDSGGSSEPTTEVVSASASGVEVVGDGDESALQRRDRAIEALLDAMTRKLKRAMQDEQNDLLDRLRNHRGRAAETLLPTPQAQADRFRSAALPFLADAAAEGVAFYGGHVSEAIAVQDLAENLAFSIVGPLRRRLEAALADGQLDDAGTVAEHVGAAYREWKSQRIEQVAGDHAVAAFSRGILAGASPRSTWRWVVDDQGTPCPDCDDNALAGAVPANESFPTGQLHPPAHTGCRCLLVPGR